MFFASAKLFSLI